MDRRLLSLYLSRILSGEYIFVYDNNTYKLIYPGINIRYEADLFAQEQFDNNKFNEWISDDDIVDWLVDAGLWSYDGDKKLEQFDKQIEDLKVDLYKSVLNPAKVKTIKRNLNSIRHQYDRFYSIRHSFDHITISGYCEMLKNQYILLHSLYKDNKLVFEDVKTFDHSLLNNISSFVTENIIDVNIFRLIARSDLWRGYWAANKNNIFDKPTIHWTEEQKTLVVLSKMYDSAYEHPECPADNIIEDDDMFDGWMILQRRENEENKAKNRNEKMLKDKKLGNAKEVFLMANNKAEAENIFNLNDANSRNIINERNQFLIVTNKDVSEAQLPDVQRDLVVQNNQKFIQSRKK